MTGKLGTGELVLVGRIKAQLREASPQSITDEQIETFFSELADTCNVVRSAKAAGFSANWAYRKRKMDAGFRAGWARAVAEGYAKLELVLLDRAMNGTVKRVPSSGSEKRIREYPNQLAMALLKRHSDMAGSIDSMLSEEEAEESGSGSSPSSRRSGSRTSAVPEIPQAAKTENAEPEAGAPVP